MKALQRHHLRPLMVVVVVVVVVVVR